MSKWRLILETLRRKRPWLLTCKKRSWLHSWHPFLVTTVLQCHIMEQNQFFPEKKEKIEYATACHCHACVPLDRPILRQPNMTTNNRTCLTHYTYTYTSSCSLKYTIRYSVKTLTFPMVTVKLVVLQPSARPWPLSENVPWVTSVVPHLFWPLPFFGPQDAVEAPRAQGGCVGQPPPNNHA